MNTFTSMNRYNKPPTTPSLKRRSVVTTPVCSAKRQRFSSSQEEQSIAATTTPVRTAATKQRLSKTSVRRVPGPSLMTPSHSRRHHRHGCCTPASSKSSRGGGGGDRFIPNRAKTDVAKARHSLRSKDNTRTDMEATPAGEEMYQRQLRRVLFGKVDDNGDGDNENRDDRMMSFGSSTTTNMPSCRVRQNDPRDLDTLCWKEEESGKSSRPKIAIRAGTVLGAKGYIVDDDDLTLMSSNGGMLAVAIYNEVFVTDCEGTINSLAKQDVHPFTCVQYSNCGTMVALGSRDGIEILQPSNVVGKDHTMLGALVDSDEGFVTAIAWKGLEILKAGQDGLIRRCNLLAQKRPVVSYQGYDEDELVTALEWKHNWIASAGGNTIRVWHDEQKGVNIEPRMVLEHDGVKTLEFCPHLPHLLVSGGDDGLKFWNILDGSLQGTIETEQRVAGTMFSKTKKEILVAHGNKLSVWSFGSKVVKLAEIKAVNKGRIISMKQGCAGTVVCACDDSTIPVFSLCHREGTRVRKSLGPEFQGLKLSAIR